MATSIDLRAERAKLWERAKEIVDAAETENRNLTAEEDANWAKLNEDMAALDARIQRQEILERTPATEQRGGPLQRPESRDAKPAEQVQAERRAAFTNYLRFGYAGMPAEQRAMLSQATASPEEQRAMGIGSDVAGGYWVPDEPRRAIEMAMLTFSGMREAGTVIQTTSGGDLPAPTVNDTSNTGELVGEHQTVTEQDVSLGQVVLRAYMYSSKEVKVSLELLQDSAYDVEAMLRDIFAQRLGRIQNTHFTSRGGTGPTGIINDAVNGQTAAATGSITSDELIGLEYSVDRAYRVGARFMFHSNTCRDIRKLKDGDGRYIWQPGMQAGQPNTLNGYPYTVNDDMPTMATGVKSVLFGLLSKYLIRDVTGIQVLRLNERHAENRQVAFFAYQRTDGKLIDAGTNPVKCITQA